MALVEYLYVDEERLDTYFQQISSPVTYDKVPVWEASLTITSPGAKGSQHRFARPYTTHEKISNLTEHLEEEGLVGFGRAGEQEGWRDEDRKVFRIETCRARRVFIPPDRGQPPEVGALTVWISAKLRTRQELEFHADPTAKENPARKPGSPRPPGNLYLLEDDRHPDSQIASPMSAYSALSLMVGDFPVPGRGNDHPYRQYFEGMERPTFGWTPDSLLNDVSDQQKDFLWNFLHNPAAALQHLGALVGPVRTIRTLYRVRAYFPEEELVVLFNTYDMATFGYPIFIAEATYDA